MRLLATSLLVLLMSGLAQARSLSFTITAEVRAPGADDYEYYWTAENVEVDGGYVSCNIDTKIHHEPLPCRIEVQNGDSILPSKETFIISDQAFRGIWLVMTDVNPNLNAVQKQRFYENIRESVHHRHPVEFVIYDEAGKAPITQPLVFTNKYGDNGASRITITRHE